MNKKPTVMISSTFYDLRQVRADLAPFFSDDLGFDVLLSETPSFPVEPDVDTVQNCTRRVEQHADILVLLIGGRYGFVDGATSRSVTNLEYLTARAKGIPVYAFVEKQVLAVLPVYKENKGGRFASIVDDVRVFDFIVQVREEHSNWCFEFEVAQDIIQALRQQLAFLTYRGLVAQRQLSTHPHLTELKLLSGEALQHALERRSLWEHRTFASALIAEVENRKELRRRHELGIAFGEFRHIQANHVQSWFSERMAERLFTPYLGPPRLSERA